MIPIPLKKEQIDKVLKFAGEVKKKDYYKEEKLDRFVLGFLGEHGYANYKNIAWAPKYFRYKGDGGKDFKDIQVKTISWGGKNKELKINPSDACLSNPEVKNIVLMYVNPYKNDTAYIVGEVSVKNFLAKKSEKEYNKTTLYVLDESKLDVTY